jgi:hypothetical protein
MLPTGRSAEPAFDGALAYRRGRCPLDAGTLSAPPHLKFEQATEIAIVSPKPTPIRPRHEDAAKLMRAVREAVRSGARAGMTSYNEIAEMLNAKGISAPRAGRWTAQSVATALERAREIRSESE